MRTAVATVFAVLLVAPSALAAGDPEIAALQVGLHKRGLYGGSVDGVPGRQTRNALGGYGRRAPLGRRMLVSGTRGWDVAALEFALAWHGFPSGGFDGIFGPSLDRALRGFQLWAGLRVDGLAGSSVVAALRAPLATCPIRLAAPVAGPYTDLFGPRGRRFHTGIDYPAAKGTPVTAAASGLVIIAGWSVGGWGRLVTIEHSSGTRTLYAHLSRVGVRPGQRVEAGQRIGRVGASGGATGPHLHFEVQVRGAAVDPLTGL